MTTEGTGWSKFAQFVTYHLIGNKNGKMFASIMNRDSVPNHNGYDSGGTRPGSYNLFLAIRI